MSPLSLAPPVPITNKPGLLATKKYSPSSNISIPISSTSFVDIDATNLVVTFVAPASGKVLVKLSVLFQLPGSGANTWWNLRADSSNVVDSEIYIGNGASNAEYTEACVQIEDLSPGVVYSWKWGVKNSSGTSTVYVGRTAGSPQGSAIMEVWDAAPTYSEQVIAGVRAHKFVNYAAGNLNTSSTSFVDVGLADIVLGAQVGDTIEYGVVLQLSSGVSNLTALDIVTVAAGAAANATPINTFGGAALTDGVFRNQYADGNMHLCTGSVMYVVVAGDIPTGLITLRLRWKVNTGTAVITADGQRRAHIWAKNLGMAAA